MTKESNQKRTFGFTDRALRGLPTPPKPQQLDYFDATTRGLGLRISYGGRRTFFLLYSDERKKRQRLSLGEYGQLENGKLSLAEARKRAKIQLGAVAQAHNPAAEARAQRQAPTVEALAADFIVMQRRLGRKSADAQERMLALNVIPEIGNAKGRDVSRADISRIMDAMTERGAPIQANRVHEVVRAMFTFAIEEEIYGIEHNPAAALAKHRNPERGRERWLSLEELGHYWNALEDKPAADALRLCLLTGQRNGNVRAMKRDQLVLDDSLWIIPGSTTKTGTTYKVPLSAWAVEIIKGRIAEAEAEEKAKAKRERRQPLPVDWVFPARVGDGHARHTFVQKPHRAACRRANIEDYRLHDHRHSFATHCEAMGISRLIWDGIMGHSGNGMADLYSGHDFAQERLACMKRWADRIAATVAENVVNIEDRRA